MYFTITSSVPAHAAAGACYTCRTVGNEGSNKTYLDTGIDIAGEGGLVLCLTCVEEMARTIGYVPASQFAGLTKKVKSLNIENEALKDKATRLDDLVGLLAVRADAQAP